MPSLGMKLDAIPTEQVVSLAAEIERHGLDEVWVCEDLGRNGGIAQAALALAATERCKVGLGILPAAVRNVGYLAMEIASLCRAHPGRFQPALGHGMPGWLAQVGAHPGKILPCLEEVTLVTRSLLAGETVSFHGRYLDIEDVALEFPPPEVPPLPWGVRGPKGIELASRVADGLVLAEGSGPAYVARARQRMADPEALIVVFAWFSIDSDTGRAAERLRGTVTEALTQDFMQAQVGELGATEVDQRVLSELTVSGDAAGCAEAIARLRTAGADTVVLQPIPGSEREQLSQIAPLLAALGGG
jgi:5,10-methylenetetrahydromethanopterin reductase